MDARAINADIFKPRTSLLNRIEGRSLLGSIKYYHSIFDRYQRTPLLMTETISNGGTFQASQIEEEDEEDVETALVPLITEIEEEEDEDAEATMRLGESRQLSLFCLAGGNMYKEGEDEEDEVECDTLDPNPTASPIKGEHIGDTENMEGYQVISEASKEETELTRRSGFAILIKYFRKRVERAFAHMRYWVLNRGPTLWKFEKIWNPMTGNYLMTAIPAQSPDRTANNWLAIRLVTRHDTELDEEEEDETPTTPTSNTGTVVSLNSSRGKRARETPTNDEDND